MTPDITSILIRFALGLAVGSFLNVVSLRYDPARFLFSRRSIGGRSHCPHCQRTLRWFELIPFFSYLALGGRCRTCRKRLTLQYPLAELGTGLIFAFAPSVLRYSGQFLLTSRPEWMAVLWMAALVLLLLLALIDRRTQIIPDEINVLLVILGAARILLETPATPLDGDSFISKFALLFGLTGNLWLNHIAAALLGGAFFGILVLATRGRGMGLGDVKLAFALGFLYGWPDIIFITMFAFLIGGLFGVWKIWLGRGRLRTAVPFGPFLALGALIVMIWGNGILSWYFSLFGIIP